jgi:natural product precursor
MKTNFSNLKKRNVLSHEQMNFFKGGVATGTCSVYIPKQTANLYVDNAGAIQYNSNTGEIKIHGVSKESALTMIAGQAGARWCCDSCSSASWMQ